MKTCFVISSIGSEDTPKRTKADALLEYVIKPVLEPLGYEVTRADAIAAPNNINRGIVEYLEDADLVVADVHDHNPNVFYELGIRNVVNKPYILIKKQGERLPFDIEGNRAINHPFPEIESEDGEEIRKKYEKTIEKTKDTLTRFTVEAEKNKEAAAENPASLYLKRIKIINTLENQKKTLRYAAILATIVVAGVLSFLAFNIMEHDVTIQNITSGYENKLDDLSLSNWKNALNQQSMQIESDIYDNIDMVIFATLEFETHLKYAYNKGPHILGSGHMLTPTEFIKGLKENGNFVGPFEKEFQTTPISAYVYLAEHGDPCTFVAYPYLDHMERDGIGRGLQTCDFMDDNELIVADIHASTGTTDYSFAIAKNVDLVPNDSKVDLIISTAVDLLKFSEQVENNIHLDKVRYVLENRNSQIIFDCMKDGCPLNYKEKAVWEKERGTFNKHSQPLTYNLGDFPGYAEYESIDLTNSKLSKPHRNSMLLEGWTLHVLLPKDDPAHDK